MRKIGRNEPCPCGSGRKYKQCCLSQREAAHAAEQASAQERKAAVVAVDGLAIAGRMDEAELAARQLIQRWPNNYEGYYSLGLVHQLSSNHQAAADCYWKVLEILDARADLHTPEFIAFHRHLALKAQEAARIVDETSRQKP